MIRFNCTCLLILFIFLFGDTSSLMAQKKWVARDSVLRDFKNGTLVVRLKSHDKKLKKIDALLKDNNIGNSDKKRLEDKRDYIITNRDRFNQELIAAFGTAYSFSNVAFIYDKDLKKFRTNDRDQIFLNQDLDPSNEPPVLSGTIYYFGEGQTNTSGNSVEGLLVMDENSKQLPGWFPNYFRTKSNLKSFFGMFSTTKYTYRPPEKSIRKFQSQLDRLWTDLQKRQNTNK